MRSKAESSEGRDLGARWPTGWESVSREHVYQGNFVPLFFFFFVFLRAG